MIYKKREDLIIINTDNVLDSILLSDIKNLITKPNFNLYFENNNYIYGIVNINEILDAVNNNLDNININKDFNSLENKNYFNVKNYFNENEMINEVPIVRDNKLLGAYINSINFSCLKELYSFIDLKDIVNSKKVCIIRTSNYYDDSKIKFFKNFFESYGALFFTVTYLEFIDGNEDYDYVLFETYSELDNYKTISEILDKVYSSMRYSSLFSIYETFNDDITTRYATKYLSSFLKRLQDQGVNVFNVYISFDDYTIALLKEIDDKYKRTGSFFSEKVIPYKEEFFGELYDEEYIKKILDNKLNFKTVSGINYLPDYESEVLNIKDGIRLTTDTIEDPRSCIHMFGPCLVIGIFVEDKYTIESFLQRRLDDSGVKMNVINHGAWNNTLSQMEMINNTDIYSGDTILFFQLYDYVDDIPNIDIMEFIKENNVPVEWFVDGIVHVNHKVNEIYADGIYGKMLPYLYKNNLGNLVNKDFDITSKVYLDRYFSNIDLSQYKEIGAIIMNCNPLTKGHHYLVEEASKMVDFLIVFIVNEQNSSFDFYDRFAIAREGLKDIPNVYVVPSWYALLSRTTIPEYFSKSVGEDFDYHLQKHSDYFGDYIAPFLNIKTRFVGTEPIDEITNKLNEAIKRDLPKKGIKVVEIERKMYKDNPISASLARKLMDEDKTLELKNYLPESTIKYIFEDVNL